MIRFFIDTLIELGLITDSKKLNCSLRNLKNKCFTVLSNYWDQASKGFLFSLQFSKEDFPSHPMQWLSILFVLLAPHVVIPESIKKSLNNDLLNSILNEIKCHFNIKTNLSQKIQLEKKN